MTVFERWDDWLNDYERWLVEKDQSFYLNEYFKKLRPAWRSIADQIRSFFVPTLTFPKLSTEAQKTQDSAV